jgi:alpha-D-ribose 1-methylphosphonate 5-triphosphate diphosphatase
MSVLLRGGCVLRPDGTFEEADLAIKEGRLASLGFGNSRSQWQAHGLLVLPGIVDLHGDAFERQLMPRPGVHFPVDVALFDTDRQMVANGITTAFHGLTWSWEPGLRGDAAAFSFIEGLDRLRGKLACDTRVHLRQETFNLSAERQILDWLAAGRISILAFNDHMDDIIKRREPASGLKPYADRSGLGLQEFDDLLRQVEERAPKVPASVERLADAARAASVTLLSHDDGTPEQRLYYHNLGCAISEFPLNRETARSGRSLGSAIVMGSPNVMRGGSHCGGIAAAEAVREGLCDILTSDYYYPALLHAPFRLAREGACSLAEAWRLVSDNPARAAGLFDRGTLEEGKRADLILVDARDPAMPRVQAVFVGGKPVYAVSDALGLLV